MDDYQKINRCPELTARLIHDVSSQLGAMSNTVELLGMLDAEPENMRVATERLKRCVAEIKSTLAAADRQLVKISLKERTDRV